MPDDIHVLESLPAYALGSLDEMEARMVAEHLASCLMCRAELSEFQTVVDHLGFVVPDASPSADLKSRLMERVQGSSLRRSQSTRWHFPQRLLPVGGLVSLFLIAVLALSNLLLWQRMNNLEVLRGPLGMRAIALENTTAAPAASGFVIISSDGENGVLVVDELPVLEPEREYQLWLVRDEQVTSGAVFSVDEDGYRGMRIQAPQSLLTYSEVYVTIEPVGGSDAPVGERLLGGSLFNP